MSSPSYEKPDADSASPRNDWKLFLGLAGIFWLVGLGSLWLQVMAQLLGPWWSPMLLVAVPACGFGTVATVLLCICWWRTR